MSNTTKGGIAVSIENGMQIIRFDNPRKYNAIQFQAYTVITSALQDAANNPAVLFTVLTGTPPYYSSGFDISDSGLFSNRSVDVVLNNIKSMIDALVDYPKLLIAVVNGPAIGLAVTTLGLCDIIYASDKATFQTPFSKLGLCAEGCASYTFPLILGKSKANEVLLVGHKMSAEEACRFGLISEVIKHSELHTIWGRIAEFKEVNANSIRITKQLSKRFDSAKLHEANRLEMEQLKTCFDSEEFSDQMYKFLSRKSKL